MDPSITFVLGVAAAVAGYLLKRWWEGQSARESIQEAVQLASLHKEIREGTVTLEALRDLKGDLRRRNLTSQQNQEEVVEGIGRILENEDASGIGVYEPQTQGQMTTYARHLANVADQELQFIVEALRPLLTNSEGKAFSKSQVSWEKFVDAQSILESLEAEGGTMQPMLYQATRRSLIIERAAKIREELKKRKRIDWDDLTD